MPATPTAERDQMRLSRTVHVLVHGQVQGVGFRAWVEHQAELRGLGGWVRNRRDGTVEAVFTGPSDAVEAMLATCHDGPSSARVDRVETKDAEALALGSDRTRFEVKGTV